MINLNSLTEIPEHKLTEKNENDKTIDLIISKKSCKNFIQDSKNIYLQIKTILGDNFKYNWIFGEKEDKKKIYSFEFINKSLILNKDKTKYIKEKIIELNSKGFLEVEDLKIKGIGRYIVVKIKTIKDYEKEKKIIEKEYFDKINEIDNKIKITKFYE